MGKKTPALELVLEKPCTIETIRELMGRFGALFAEAGPAEHATVLVRLKRLQEMDCACIQLLQAAKLEAERRGWGFSIQGTASEDVMSFLSLGGFLDRRIRVEQDLDFSSVRVGKRRENRP